MHETQNTDRDLLDTVAEKGRRHHGVDHEDRNVV
jgi:hypothetical protein